MCEKCKEAIDKYWTGLPEPLIGELLMNATCFPFGDHNMVAKQLRQMSRRSNQNVEKAIILAHRDLDCQMKIMKRLEEITMKQEALFTEEEMTQIHMFADDERVEPRPTSHDDSVLEQAASVLVEQYNGWLEEGGDEPDDEREIIEILKKVLADSYNFDGYKICRDLERHYHIDPDSQLVEIMDDVGFLISSAEQTAVQNWVKRFGIQPRFKVGDKVSVGHPIKGKHLGEITKVDEKEAKYTIYVEAIGHVREGSGTHGWIKNFEEVENANKEAVA